MKKRKEKEFKIRTYLTGIIWLALACSMIISALLFAFLKHFLEMPENIPAIVWLLIFNTMIAGLITVLLNGKVLEPITKLSEAMKDVSQGDFDKQLETSSCIAEVVQSYNSFNVMTKELRATQILQMDFVSNVSHEFKTPINAIEGYTMLLQGEELSNEQNEYVEKILFNTQRLSCLVGNILLLSKLENQNIPMKKTKYRLDEQIRQAILSLESKWTQKEIDLITAAIANAEAVLAKDPISQYDFDLGVAAFQKAYTRFCNNQNAGTATDVIEIDALIEDTENWTPYSGNKEGKPTFVGGKITLNATSAYQTSCYTGRTYTNKTFLFDYQQTLPEGNDSWGGFYFNMGDAEALPFNQTTKGVLVVTKTTGTELQIRDGVNEALQLNSDFVFESGKTYRVDFGV